MVVNILAAPLASILASACQPYRLKLDCSRFAAVGSVILFKQHMAVLYIPNES